MKTCKTCCYWGPTPERGKGICLCGDSDQWNAPYTNADDTCDCWEAQTE